MPQSMSPEVIQTLLDSQDRFPRFLTPRLGIREAAQDTLQGAFVKALASGNKLRDEGSVVAWFYRILRNAVSDHQRRRAVEDRLQKAASIAHPPEHDLELEKAVCRCVKDILPTLKREYSDILQKVDLESIAGPDVAKSRRLTSNNAMVRLHHARKALHRRLIQTCGTCTEHGCLDCHCKR